MQARTERRALRRDKAMKNVLTMLLAGGAGERLYPLTRDRAKPAVYFGGMYRIIDFALSNCVNSNCRRIGVLVQYKSISLVRHINYAWAIFRPELGEFIETIPPQMRVSSNWYLGTADAIYQNLYSINQSDCDEVLILSGDQIYKMNYMKTISFHRLAEADLTIAAIEVPITEAHRFGVLEVDASGRVLGFEEKPEAPRCVPGKPNVALASMGIYVFNREILRDVVSKDAGRVDSSHDFGKDIIPRMLETHAVYAHRFEDENKKDQQYWRDVGTLDTYWEANMDLVSEEPQFNLYDKEWPLRTAMPTFPPAKFVFGDPGDRYGVAVDSIVSPGCIVSGGTVSRCVLGPQVRIHSFAQVEESILFAGSSVGRHARVRRAIIEKGVHIPDHAVIGYDLEHDAMHHRVTEQGIVVVDVAPPYTAQKAFKVEQVPLWCAGCARDLDARFPSHSAAPAATPLPHKTPPPAKG